MEDTLPQDHDALQALKESLTRQFAQTPPGPLSDAIDARLDRIDAALTALNSGEVAPA